MNYSTFFSCELYKLNGCTNDFCQNGGRCIEVKTNLNETKIECKCPREFTGSTCFEPVLNVCASNPCSYQKGHICMDNGDNTFACLCVGDESCFNESKLLDRMQSSPEIQNELYKLMTDYNLSSKNTTEELEILLKNENEIINKIDLLFHNENNSVIITKRPTTIDNLLELAATESCPKECLNDGICRNNTCECKYGYVGEYCQRLDGCLLHYNLCQNGGTCEMRDDIVSCICPQDYSQPYCETKINLDQRAETRLESSDQYCQINVCKNDGICVYIRDDVSNRTNQDSFLSNNTAMKCQCKPNYSGVFCQDYSNKEMKSKRLSLKELCQSASHRIVSQSAL
jgi:hypothetical protein